MTSQARTTPQLITKLARSSLNFMVHRPIGGAGIIIIIVMCLMALFAEFITFHDPLDWSLKNKLASPNGEFWLGTDDKGRDLWARMTMGARVSLQVGFLSVAFQGDQWKEAHALPRRTLTFRLPDTSVGPAARSGPIT